MGSRKVSALQYAFPVRNLPRTKALFWFKILTIFPNFIHSNVIENLYSRSSGLHFAIVTVSIGFAYLLHETYRLNWGDFLLLRKYRSDSKSFVLCLHVMPL